MTGRATLGLALGLTALALVAAGCLTQPDGGDTAPREDPDEPDEPDRSEPPESPERRIGPAPNPVTGLAPLASLEAEAGLGVAARGPVAYVAAPSGLYTVDVSNPEAPERLGVEHEAASRYVDLITYPDRIVAAASGANQEVLHFVDVTDPTAPQLLASLDPDRTVHNVAVMPGTHLVYNPRGVGDPVEPGIDIVDASDPADPQVLTRWQLPERSGGQPTRSPGCAVVTFDTARERAFCPAVDQTYVLDVANRTQPELVSAITNPAITVHHWTAAVDGGSTLLIADWAAAANAPTCGRAGPLADTQGPPAGAVWTYNLSDPADPEPLGWVAVEAPDDLGPDQPCSPHVLAQVPGQPVVAAAWHHGGVALVDAGEPSQPTVLDRWADGSNAWALAVHGNVVLTGDRDAGLDVLELTG